MPPRYMSSADFDAVVTHTAPAILHLLGDGRPRSNKAIVTALAERHPKDEIVRTPACCMEVGGTVGSGAVPAARVLLPCRTRPMPAAVIISLGRSGA